jgi:hypothetical protein
MDPQSTTENLSKTHEIEAKQARSVLRYKTDCQLNPAGSIELAGST